MKKQLPKIAEAIIRKCVRKLILSEAGEIGDEMDAQERAAKEVYEAAAAELKAWEDNEEKRQAFLKKAKEMGVSYDTARKRLKNDPKYDFIPTQKKLKTLEDNLSQAEERYADYNPELRGFVRRRKDSSGARSIQNKELPPKGKKSYMSIDSLKPCKWYEWPAVVDKSGKSFGTLKTKTSEDIAGTGPGEEWLGFIFGGQVQGGGVSFDIVTPDGRTWEVKGLESQSSLIRPGTEGLKAFDEPKKRLDRIMTQMKNFATIARKVDFDQGELSDVDDQIISSVESFVDDEFEMIVKGEIPRERLI